ncbi:hypothetical protein AVEN_148126-1 [Araneus ventricosus]|uniref:C2H2-type domain-containing protein n=1 Tax=Araneus ventricosus TaxID=182803 RepID=A0A4Y2SMF2_ARAVE|nr:hypothetical protein AVEN_148126-1 [Araneus ventricosus]
MATAGFTCELCSKWFRTKIGLGVHSQSQHGAEDDLDPDPDVNLAVSSGVIAGASSDVLQAVRGELEAANTSLMELSVNESMRLEQFLRSLSL